MLTDYISKGFVYFSDGHAEEILSLVSVSFDTFYFTTISGRYSYSEIFEVVWSDEALSNPYFRKKVDFEKRIFEENRWEKIDTIEAIVFREKLGNGEEKKTCLRF